MKLVAAKRVAAGMLVTVTAFVAIGLSAGNADANTYQGLPVQPVCNVNGNAGVQTDQTALVMSSFKQTTLGSTVYVRIDRYRAENGKWVLRGYTDQHAASVDAQGYRDSKWMNMRTERVLNSSIIGVTRMPGTIRMAIRYMQYDDNSGRRINSQFEWVEWRNTNGDCRY